MLSVTNKPIMLSVVMLNVKLQKEIKTNCWLLFISQLDSETYHYKCD
jgi:hypothetical protein